MKALSHRIVFILPLFLLLAGEGLVFLFGPFGMPKERSEGDWLFLSLIVIHFFLLYALSTKRGKELAYDLLRTSEILFAVTLLLFLFSYIYASNANMSYAQWFAETSGNIRLAPDSRIQRLNSLLRYGPLILYDLILFLWSRLCGGAKGLLFNRILKNSGSRAAASAEEPAISLKWGLAASILSALLYSFSIPSFAVTRGIAPLAFIALVPLYFVLRTTTYRWALFYGVFFGAFQTLLSNYWLGTFSLISLHFAVLILTVEYLLFFLPTLAILRKFPRILPWLLPLLWTGFEYLRSVGFLGYPWGFLGSSLYRTPLLIQLASLGGIWLVSFTVHLSNGLIFEFLYRFISTKRSAGALRHRHRPFNRHRLLKKPELLPLTAFLVLWVFILAFGAISISSFRSQCPDKTIRIALIQQNTDPRKHNYRTTFDKLTSLTRETLAHEPELIAWSETAFVPNIRKWGEMDPNEHRLAELVNDFLDFQKSTDTWLVTGNDDYEDINHSDGSVTRDHYNAVVFLSDEGKLMDVYRKIRLVPFTEYFPYKEKFPWLHGLLKDFDARLWEKGERKVVFSHPKADFCTPICFEDSFPEEIRRFAEQGADLILNLSNDFWSRTEVEGEQHFANGLFRAVELRRPLVRSTASGKTAYVDPTGRVRAELPYYSADTLVVDVGIYEDSRTLYQKWGDWFPKLALIIAAILFIGGITRTIGARHVT